MGKQIANDTFLRALRFERVAHTPVWLMRQAGRFLPEYNALRERAGSFMAMAQTPELAAQATLQPVTRYPLDAAIVFSDILTVPHAMGLGLSFAPGRGPVFERPVRSGEQARALSVPDPEDDLGYVMEAVRLSSKALDGRLPLIGFAGSPFTLACYMIEGASGTDFRTVKKMLFEAPDVLETVLEVNARSVEQYLLAQIRAGADAVQIFDTWGGILARAHYERFSLSYIRRIVRALRREAPEIPVIVFTKGGAAFLEDTMECGATAVGLDWTIDLAKAKALARGRVALQGNMDPAALLAGPEAASREALRVLASFGDSLAGGLVFNLGHGVDKDACVDSVQALVEAVHGYAGPA